MRCLDGCSCNFFTVTALPDDFEAAWGLISHAFGGWPPSEMDGMDLEQFMRWYNTALDLLKAQAEAMKSG